MRMVYGTVDAACDGAPLWFALQTLLGVSDRSLRRAKHTAGSIVLDGLPARTNALVSVGQTVGIAIDDASLAPEGGTVEPEAGPLCIVYEDEDLVVVDKPAGLVAHPCSGQRSHTLGNYLVHHLQATGQGRDLHPVHRLDQGTSGLMVFATSGHAQKLLQDQLHTGAFERTYLALCHGVFEKPSGMVDAPIGRIGYGPRSFDVSPTGKRAVTRYRVLGVYNANGSISPASSISPAGSINPTGSIPYTASASKAFSLVELQLETGRTHQIRVHMAWLGHPLLGDAAYGDATDPASSTAGPASGAAGQASGAAGQALGATGRASGAASRASGAEDTNAQAAGPIDRAALHSWRLRLTQPFTSTRIELEAPLPRDMHVLVAH